MRLGVDELEGCYEVEGDDTVTVTFRDRAEALGRVLPYFLGGESPAQDVSKLTIDHTAAGVTRMAHTGDAVRNAQYAHGMVERIDVVSPKIVAI